MRAEHTRERLRFKDKYTFSRKAANERLFYYATMQKLTGISPAANIFASRRCLASGHRARSARCESALAEASRVRRGSSAPIEKAAFERLFLLEQMTGIEPAFSAWEADALPLSYICIKFTLIIILYFP